jgi:hypothetical protein
VLTITTVHLALCEIRFGTFPRSGRVIADDDPAPAALACQLDRVPLELFSCVVGAGAFRDGVLIAFRVRRNDHLNQP